MPAPLSTAPAASDAAVASPVLGAVLQPVLDSAPDAGFLLDATGCVQRVGARAEDLLGPPAGSWVGRHASDLVAPELARAFSRRVAWLSRRPGTRVSDLLVAVCHADGSTRPATAWLSEVDGTGLVLLWLRALTPDLHPSLPSRSLRADLPRDTVLVGGEVVQAIAAAAYAHQRGDGAVVDQALALASRSARHVAASLALAGAGSTTPAPRTGAAAATPSSVDDVRVAAPPVSTHDGVVTVLVADGSGPVRTQLRRILGAVPGVEVVDEVADGATAAAHARRRQPDLVVLDLELPGPPAGEVIRAIRTCSPAAHVVALGGWSPGAGAGDALASGASAHLEKGGSVSRFGVLVDDLFPARDRSARSGVGATDAPRTPVARQADLVSVCAHELRSPLTAQLLAVDLALEGDLDQDDRDLLGRVRANTLKMNRLVQNLCDANRSGVGTLDLTLAPASLGRLVSRLLSSVEHVLPPERCRVEVLADGVVAVDVHRIEQVLENLVSNAVKFGPVGAEVLVQVLCDQERATVEVSDHGAGIRVVDRRRVFEKFERLGSQAPGIGLGTYLSREIARAHGGDLAVVDGPTSGATFRLTLPVVV